MSKGLRLDIGCGRDPRSGFTGVDRYVESAPVHADMWELPYGDCEVDEIFSTHALEHIGKYQVVPTLKEWYRVLVPTGLLTLEVPDLMWCVLNWLQCDDSQKGNWPLDAIFGNQEHPGEFHKTGFTEPILTRYLWEAGFRRVRISVVFNHAQNTLHAETRRPG